MKPGLLLGLGIGGFIDGIVLHMLLEWHHMLSGWYPDDTRHNMIGDGLFHLVCLILVTIGVYALHSSPTPLTRGELTGWILAGWGIFNIVEGIIDHLILGVHHVRHGPHELWWDLGFLLFGLALVAIGWTLANDQRRYKRMRSGVV